MATAAAFHQTPKDTNAPAANVSDMPQTGFYPQGTTPQTGFYPQGTTPQTGFYPQGTTPQTGSGAVISNSQFVGMHVIQPSHSGTAVLVTQPVVTVPDPPVTCAIVWSTLSSIFCCCICGITGILIAWKARLYVLQRKYEEARHSISLVWLFFGLAIFFGLVTWTVVGLYCGLILPGQIRASFDNYYYRYNNYNGR